MLVSSHVEDKKKRKRKKVDTPKKKPDISLSELNADDFMATFVDDEPAAPEKQTKTKGKKKKEKIKSDDVPEISEEADEELDKKAERAVTTGKDVVMGISKLQEKDADFFKFLQENDPELLNFSGESEDDDDEDSEGIEEEEEDEEEEEEEEEEEIEAEEELPTEKEEEADIKEKVSHSTAVTKQHLVQWESALKRNSLPSWRELVKAFQAAVATAKGEEETDLKYCIVDPDMVNKVILLSLGNTSQLLHHHLGDSPTASPKWGKLKMSLKSYLTSLTELLGLLTSDDVLCAVMRHCKAMLSYYAAFSRLLKKYIKQHIMVWGSKAELSRVVAFTCLQAVVKKMPVFLEELLKKMYTEYTKCSKMMSPKSRDNIVLMRNCLVELFKINPSITYTTGFLYIRQLAVTLRSVIVNKKETETVYNWQYVNCLHVWVSVLADCDACLQPLIFPLIQVMMGTLKLHSSPCFHPLHLHVIRMLLHLGASTNKHIPLLHPLLEILEFCTAPHKAPATKPIDLTCVLRVTKGYKKTKAFQEGVFELTYELLLNYTSQLSLSISFPEVAFPITVWLKKWNKRCTIPKYTGQIKQILEKVDTVSREMTDRRSSVTFSPKDLEKVTQWESELPESALTKYFNTWLRIHRKVLADKSAAEEKEENKEAVKEENDKEKEEEEEEEEKEQEAHPRKKKKLKKKKKSSEKTEEIAKSTDNSVVEAEVIDNGDLVEDIVLSD